MSLSKVYRFPFLSETNTEVKTISIKSFEKETEEEERPNVEAEKESLEKKKQAVALEIEEKLKAATQQATELIESAKAEAETIRAALAQEEEAVRSRLAAIQEEAKEQGFNEGFEQGLEAGKAEYESVILEAKNVVQLAKQDYFKTIERAEPVILDLALAISEKIIGQMLVADEKYWHEVVRTAIFEVREQQEVKIYVHPDSYEKTLKHKDELESIVSQVEQLHIYPDSELPPFGCIIETPYGKIEASVDSQLREIKKQLHEKLKENNDEGT